MLLMITVITVVSSSIVYGTFGWVTEKALACKNSMLLIRVCVKVH